MQIDQSTELVKLDLCNAYCVIPVHADDQPLLGICWQGNTFIDHALPFGLRSVPKIFNAIANFLAWVLHCEGISYLIHCLDDFLVFPPPGSNIAAPARALVQTIFNHIGAPLHITKPRGQQ